MRILYVASKMMVLVLLTLTFAVSCCIDLGSEDKPETDSSLQLTFSVPNGSLGNTKSIPEVTQTGTHGYFHGMTGIKLLSFNVARKIEATDLRQGISSMGGLASDTHQASNYAFLFPIVSSVPYGTTSMLVYGKSAASGDENTTSFKRRYGALAVSDLDAATHPVDITFSPQPIWASTGFPSEAATLAGYLTALATTSVTQNSVSLAWKDTPAGSGLIDIFNRFANKAGNAYSVTGLSGKLTAALLTDVYTSLKSFNSTDGTYSSLRDQLVAKIDSWQNSGIITIGDAPDYTIAFVSVDLRDFPETYGLPSGALGVRWDGSSEFTVVAQGTKGAINKYCYPPRLWYYANSLILTSTEGNNTEQYQAPNTTYDRWGEILTHYTSGGRVESDTRSIAVVDPLQYGVAMMEVILKKTAATLPDASGETNITVGTDKFPLTAIFVGGQRQQAFDFTPISDAADYVQYDSDLYTGEPTVFLSSEDVTESVKSLVLQTVDAEDIYMALEFINNSGEAFQGLDGTVIPGAKFYLLGEIKFSQASAPDGVSLGSVFVKDYKTIVKVRVVTLAEARNVIPNLSVPQLDLGVEVTLEWQQSTSTNVPMY